MTRRGVVLRLGWLVALAAGLVADPAQAQTTTASIAGKVLDVSGDPLPGAVVEARSAATGAVRAAVTGRDGAYRLDGLDPGAWTLRAEFAGQAPSTSVEVRVRLQQVLRLDLAIGTSITESVDVVADATPLDPARTGSELRIGSAQLGEVPTVGRSLTDLALLDSTVLPATNTELYGESGPVFVINGQSSRSNSFLVDGLDNNDRTSNTGLNSYFSPLAVRELVVNTHLFAPEFGRASGGVFNIVTERGGNETTGGGFVQGSRSAWNEAGELVDSVPASGQDADAVGRGAVGFKLGGAFQPDRAFYFVAYEHQSTDDIVPYTGVTRDGVAGGWAVAPNRADTLFFRTDFSWSSTHQLMVRLSGDDRTDRYLLVQGNRTPESGFDVDQRDLQLATTLTSVWRDKIHELRILAGTSRFDQSAISDRPGVERPSGTFGGNNLNAQLRDEDRIQLVDNFSWRAGAHTFKVGLDLTRLRTSIDTRFHPQGNFTYNTDVRWEPGDGYVIGRPETKCIFATDPDQVPCPGTPGIDDDGDGLVDEDADRTTFPVVYQLIFGAPAARLEDTLIGAFAQDTWQASAALLFDFGLRYDASTFELPASAAVDSVVPNGGAPPDWNNVAPRFGFTWVPKPGGKLLFRGGAGMFYDKVVLGFPAVAAITSGTAIGLTFPEGFAFEINEDVVEQLGVEAVLPDVVFPEELILRFSTGTRLDTPYTNMFHLGGAWQATPRGTLEVNVVRSLGYHIPLFKDLNPVAGTNFLGVPVHAYDDSVGSIAAIVTEGRTWYTGLDASWFWRSDDGWLRLSYTLSKAIDQGPDPLRGGVYLPPSNDFGQEEARSDSDQRHRAVLSGGVPLGLLGMRLSGVVQYASGTPYNVTTGADDNLDGITSDRPAGLARNSGEGTPPDVVNALRDAEQLAPAAIPAEPVLFQVDLRVAWPFAFERARSTSEFYLQVFNLLNRYNAGAIEGRATSATFGEPTAYAGPPRTIEVGVRLGF